MNKDNNNKQQSAMSKVLLTSDAFNSKNKSLNH